MKKKGTGLLILGVIIVLIAGLFIGLPYLMQRLLRDTTEAAIAPIAEANAQMKTQVAQFMNPTPTIIPDPVTIIQEVRSLARLESIQYSVEKVITAEIAQGQLDFLFGDRLLFVAHGTVIAGIDLGKMTTQNLWLEDGALYVNLPEPEIFVATLNNDQSYVYDRETGLLRQSDANLETQARQVAEQSILEAALTDGILVQADINAEAYMERLFRSLGYEEVIFIHETE
ncbi:MAG: DUF4230 domain-containing protein [Anaerolineaceae bacterium]|jgi:hypothetical protein|nr:DUF4230 domain-containing protein [Anaerolineaceae bacterium]